MGAQPGPPALKVLLVSEDIPAPTVGGLGKHVVSLAHALMDAGHEVTLMGATFPLMKAVLPNWVSAANSWSASPTRGAAGSNNRWASSTLGSAPTLQSESRKALLRRLRTLMSFITTGTCPWWRAIYPSV